MGHPRLHARGVALAALLCAAACGPAAATSAPAQSGEGAASSAPDFTLDTLDGGSVRLGDHVGKDVVLVDFWATYCEPCLTSMPHLNDLYEKYKSKGFVVLGVSIDGPDSAAQVRSEVQKLGVTFPILLDRETRVVGLYNPRTSAPYSVLIGRSGSVLVKREGYTTGDASELEADIVKALAQQ